MIGLGLNWFFGWSDVSSAIHGNAIVECDVEQDGTGHTSAVAEEGGSLSWRRRKKRIVKPLYVPLPSQIVGRGVVEVDTVSVIVGVVSLPVVRVPVPSAVPQLKIVGHGKVDAAIAASGAASYQPQDVWGVGVVQVYAYPVGRGTVVDYELLQIEEEDRLLEEWLLSRKRVA
jgi:hypothetical protein